MNRRVFQGTIIAVLLCASLLIGINGCSNSASPAPTAETKDITVTSSVNEGHSHTITVKANDIIDARGNSTYTTTANGTPSHTHMVTLTAQNLKDIQQGKTVTVTTSPPTPSAVVVSNHIHQFTIKK